MLSTAEKQRMSTLYGPWALVTGASSGMGRALAAELAAAGLHLVLTARRGDLLEALATDLQQRHGTQTRVVVADLGTQEGLGAVISAAHDVDAGLLVAAAGFGTSGAFVDAALTTELDMLRVNCGATLSLVHHLSRRWAGKRRAGMILFSSIVAFQGVPHAAHYAATKAYVQSLAEALAVELKPRGIDVLAAAPAMVESGFGDRANMQMGNALKPEDIAAPILRALGRRTVVFPGFLSQFLTAALATAPRWAKVRILQQVMGGFTKHQRT
ncbi:MAG: SDR family NAD(P)-dependent oxidoreductase [Bacteroidia bacterium]|nr:SDR family NAD(P)-dependent oxidoreductase [Bacteroidia bacterium]